MPSGPRPCVTGIMSGQGGGHGGRERAGRGRSVVGRGRAVKRRPPFKRSYFSSFSVPAWDFGVEVSTWLISLRWEDSAFRHRLLKTDAARGEKQGGWELQGAASDVGQSAACRGFPLRALRSVSHRLRTPEVWECCEQKLTESHGRC